MTTIQDTIYNAGGALANGQVVISSPPFTLNGVSVAASQIFVPIVDGALSVQLYPNMNAQPTGVYYTATYELDQGPVFDEYWVVPNQPTVSLGQVRVTFPATPSVMINAQQLTSAGALPGQFLGWSGGNWVPMYVTSFNYDPNFINLMVTGFAGADLSVSGSPVSLGASVTLNVPDAGATSRGVVNTAAQSFAGNKTFSNNVGVSGTLTAAGILATNVVVTGNLQAAGNTNLAINPTTAFGDLIVRGNAGALVRFPLGASGTILYADNTQPQGLRWGVAPSGGGGGTNLPAGTNTGDMLYWDQAAPTWAILPVGAPGQVLTAVGGSVGVNWTIAGQSPWTSDIDAAGYMLYNVGSLGVGVATPAYAIDAVGDCNITGAYRVGGVPLVTGVSSVFGRTGAVVAAHGDYTAAQVTNAVDQTGSYANPAWITSLPYSKITGAPAAGVASFNTRTGAVMPAAADYTAAQVTNAVDATQSYVNPPWIASLAYSKITGAPASFWQAGSGGAIYYSGGLVSIGTATPNSFNPALTVQVNGLRAAAFTGAGSDTGVMWTNTGSGGRNYSIYSSSNLSALGGGNFTIFDDTAGASRITVTAGGNVGVANTAPGYPLTVTASGGAHVTAIAVENRTTGVYGSAIAFRSTDSVTANVYSAGRIYGVFDAANFGGARLTLQNATANEVFQDVLTIKSGNTGIGTTAPAYRLDVVGDCNITGTYRANGAPISSGGGPTTWTPYGNGGGRVVGTTYTNSFGVPLYLVVALLLNAGGTANIMVSGNIAVRMSSVNGGTQAMFAIVLPGSTYIVNGSGVGLTDWSEWH